MMLCMLVIASMTSAEARQPRAGRSLPLTQTSDYEIISLDEEIETMTLPVMTADLSDAKIDTTENYEYSLAHIRKPDRQYIRCLIRGHVMCPTGKSCG